MANSAYVMTPQVIVGDFVFALPMDNTNFGGPEIYSWGIIPESAILVGNVSGLVQTNYPGRPYFIASAIGSDFIWPMGDSTAVVTKADGDIFSIHRVGSVVRFYQNFQKQVAPLPIYEATYDATESFCFYVEFSTLGGFGTVAIQPEWGTMEYTLVRGYKYSAPLQVTDFGSVQSSIKVRVAQESALVGVGDYTEKLL